MEHHNTLKELNEKSLKAYKEYLESKKAVTPEDRQKLEQAKDDWQVAWSKFLETLLVLERIEI